MARKEGRLVTRRVLMLNWLASALKMSWMSPEEILKRKVSHGINISVKRLELLRHRGYLNMYVF